MALVAAVIALALIEFLVFGLLVGRARVRCNVLAPATTGHPVFERYFRVQQNTLEQLIVFVPSVWLFGMYVSVLWAAGLGVLFVIGRVVYLTGYVADPRKRGAGFGLSFLPNAILAVGALVGAILALD
jgi:uncharacterized membrane protein YecN with MAPEG domain